MTTPIDFTPITDADVPVTHFARLCGASRISVFKWMRQQANPRGLYRMAVDHQLHRIRRALDRGTLPLPPTPRDDKFNALLRALKN